MTDCPIPALAHSTPVSVSDTATSSAAGRRPSCHLGFPVPPPPQPSQRLLRAPPRLEPHSHPPPRVQASTSSHADECKSPKPPPCRCLCPVTSVLQHSSAGASLPQADTPRRLPITVRINPASFRAPRPTPPGFGLPPLGSGLLAFPSLGHTEQFLPPGLCPCCVLYPRATRL